MNLSIFEDESMDMVLCLDPMYHLFSEEHKRKALEEAIRITKKGGIIMVAYCQNETTILQYCFGQGTIWNDIQKGLLSEDFTWTANENDTFSLIRPSDIKALTSAYPVERLGLIATDGAIQYMREKIDNISDELYSEYMDYHFSICDREDLVGASNHVLDILRKV